MDARYQKVQRVETLGKHHQLLIVLKIHTEAYLRKRLLQTRMLCGLWRHNKRKCHLDDDPTYVELDDTDVRNLLTSTSPVTPPPVYPFKMPRLIPVDNPVIFSPDSAEGDTLVCQDGLTELSNSGGYYPVGGFRTKGE